MKKLFLPVLLITAVLLSACNAAGKAAEPTAAPTSAPTQAASSGGEQTASTDTLLNKDNPCMSYSLVDRILSMPYQGLPEVTDEDYIVGPKDAPVTFMVYSEPQCPYCAQFDPLIEGITSQYPDDVRFVFRLRPFPESFHDKSILVSQAMIAAGLQGKFDAFRIWIFERQSKNPNNPAVASLADTEFWAALPPADLNKWLKDRVSELGIDPDQLLKDMVSEEVVKKVQDAKSNADAIGINGTPTMFINGNTWPENQRSVELFSVYVQLILNKKNEIHSCPEIVIDTSKSYTAILSTTKGDITVELFDDSALNTVNSFVYLARSGWYKNLPLLLSPEALITGDPSGTGYAGPGYAYLDEIDSELNFDEPGMVATMRSEENRNGSVFFISKITLPEQNGRTIFGKVTSGLDLVNTFTSSDKLLNITITEK
jgi:cyclophilin family peptidyl-prolyl cis-trans isomerase/protein-disulfide isomerase